MQGKFCPCDKLTNSWNKRMRVIRDTINHSLLQDPAAHMLMLCIMHARFQLKIIQYDPNPSRHKEIIHPFPMDGHKINHARVPSMENRCFLFNASVWTCTGWSGAFRKACKDLGHLLFLNHASHCSPPRHSHRHQSPSSTSHKTAPPGPMLGRGASPAAGSPSPVKGKDILVVMGDWQCPLQKPPPGLFSFFLCFPIQEKASVTTAADSFSDLVPSMPDITFVCCQSGKNNELPAHFSSDDFVVGGNRSFN